MKSLSKSNEALRCALCEEKKSLCDSHILPEFVYRPLYDRKHTAVKIDIEKGKREKTQKGFSEWMLCIECEGLFSKWEDYFAKVWFHEKYQLRPKRLEEKLITIKGFDYKKFKLFHLSLIWRAAVSKKREFKAVRIGPHEDKIRKMLLTENPGEPEDYQFTCLAVKDPKTLGFHDGLLRTFEASKLDGHHVYHVLFGGTFWAYWISNHTFDRLVPPCLDKNGTLLIAVQNLKDNLSILDLAEHMKRNSLFTDTKT